MNSIENFSISSLRSLRGVTGEKRRQGVARAARGIGEKTTLSSEIGCVRMA